MPKQIAYSLKSIKDGLIPDLGTMAVLLVQRGTTYKGTASMKEEAQSVFDVESEEFDDPEASFSKRGKRTLAFSTFDYSPDMLVAYKGGNIAADGAWEEPSYAPVIERSFQVITKDGTLIEIPRGVLRAVFNAEFKQDGVPLLEITITVLKPTGAGIPALRISKYTNPLVSAGNAQNIGVDNVALLGTAVANRGMITSKLWSCVSKPDGAAAPVITTPAALGTNVTGLVQGVYKFQLAVADENGFENKALVTITVALP
ncbi:PKD domain-containing protein [Mucilaginibacter glaciei]|uniref:Uncharacterized protein n=1 Tax=Mucilaginibacter glaciei TaxID=2772109 RepID=A0A926NQR4_9SPHI|nr:hypothetical protein [Mucilaginibacter glaciei]MBD1394261.1 hypothetical protein [Mucilaginibacter glaciei]